jgi:hypothetical protein
VYVFDGDNTPETVDPSELRKAVEALDKYTSDYQDVCATHKRCHADVTFGAFSVPTFLNVLKHS